MKNQHQRILVYLAGLGLVAAGGAMAKFVDPGAGAAIITAGGFLLGALQKELFPEPHRRVGETVDYTDGAKTPPVEPDSKKSE